MSPILVLQTAVISHSTMRKICSIHLIMMIQNISIKVKTKEDGSVGFLQYLCMQ